MPPPAGGSVVGPYPPTTSPGRLVGVFAGMDWRRRALAVAMLRNTSLGALLMLFLTLGCDHGTKHLAKTHLEGREPVALVSGVLDLRYAENTDTAFSLLRTVDLGADARHLLISAMATVGTLALTAVLLRRWAALGTAERVGGAALLGGALGNLSDRLWRGYVIDFVHLHHWPVFNAADIMICIGASLFFLAQRRATPLPSNDG